ncbi:MAG: thermonuclease family protein, partial [Dermatophilaceae bacterium]
MRTVKRIGIVVAAVVLWPLLPVALVVWGIRRLRSARVGTRAPIAAIATGLVLAAMLWPPLISDAGTRLAAQGPASPSTQAGPGSSTSSDGPGPSASSGGSGETTSPGDGGATDAPTTSPTPGDATGGDVGRDVGGAEAALTDGATGAVLVPVVGVLDGDTIRVQVNGATEKVRLIGIDTPELAGGQCYAQQAASRMQSLVQSRSVRLAADATQDDRDKYGRLLRHVSLPDGRLVAEVLIDEGFGREYTYAAAYEHQSQYRAAQARAQEAGRGLWGSGCAGRSSAAAPSPARTPTPPVAQAPSAAGSCVIKGNVNSKGERIYHVPGSRSYDVTTIDASKG